MRVSRDVLDARLFWRIFESQLLDLGNVIGFRYGQIVSSTSRQSPLKGEHDKKCEKVLILIENLIFFRSNRSDFKREPCKVVSILDGWTVELTDNSSQTNTFQLMNASIGTVYKFRCSSHDLTIAWLKALQKITRPPLPTNLMTFE